MRWAFLLLSFLTTPLTIHAQSPNPFSIPAGGLSATGGRPLAISWNPTTSGTISLILRSGKSDNLDEGTLIASRIPNSGNYTWTPSNNLASGTDYAIEIVSNADPTEMNYTPLFSIDTTTPASETNSSLMSKITLGATTASSKKTMKTSEVGSMSSSSAAAVTSRKSTTERSKTTSTRRNASTASSSQPASSSMAAATKAAKTTGITNGAARATGLAVGVFRVALGALAL